MPKAADNKRRVPKRILGVKVPKEARASAETLLSLMDNKLVSDTLAAALIAGAGAIAAGKDRRGAALAATLGASTAAVRSVEGARRVGLAAGIAAAELAAGMTRLLAEVEKPAKAKKVPDAPAKSKKRAATPAKAKTRTGTSAKPKKPKKNG